MGLGVPRPDNRAFYMIQGEEWSIIGNRGQKFAGFEMYGCCSIVTQGSRAKLKGALLFGVAKGGREL